jgi:hypothetical protein
MKRHRTHYVLAGTAPGREIGRPEIRSGDDAAAFLLATFPEQRAAIERRFGLVEGVEHRRPTDAGDTAIRDAVSKRLHQPTTPAEPSLAAQRAVRYGSR